MKVVDHRALEEKDKQVQFFALAARFRATTDVEEVDRLGDELGRIVFGSLKPANPTDV